MSRIVHLNGEYLPEDQAKVSVFDRGFVMADAVYEVTSVLDGKLIDFPGAVGEMAHFGLSPASLLATLVIALELGASALILSGKLRWLGALALAAFTLMASFVALRFWELPAGQERFMAANSRSPVPALRKFCSSS